MKYFILLEGNYSLPTKYTCIPSKNPAKQVPATTYSLCFLSALKWSRIAVITHSCPANMESKPNVKSMKKNKKDIKGVGWMEIDSWHRERPQMPMMVLIQLHLPLGPPSVWPWIYNKYPIVYFIEGRLLSRHKTEVFVFIRCINGTFPWKNYALCVKAFVR